MGIPRFRVFQKAVLALLTAVVAATASGEDALLTSWDFAEIEIGEERPIEIESTRTRPDSLEPGLFTFAAGMNPQVVDAAEAMNRGSNDGWLEIDNADVSGARNEPYFQFETGDLSGLSSDLTFNVFGDQPTGNGPNVFDWRVSVRSSGDGSWSDFETVEMWTEKADAPDGVRANLYGATVLTEAEAENVSAIRMRMVFEAGSSNRKQADRSASFNFARFEVTGGTAIPEPGVSAFLSGVFAVTVAGIRKARSL